MDKANQDLNQADQMWIANQQTQMEADKEKPSIPAGVIIGSVLGGVFGLVALVVVAYSWRKKKGSWW